MSYAVKIGTNVAHWIDNAPTPPGCVRYDGDITPDLVWGDDVQNLRPRNASEIAAKQAADAAEAADLAAYEADKATLKSAIATTVTRLTAIRDNASPNNAQVIAAVRDMANFQLQTIKALRRML